MSDLASLFGKFQKELDKPKAKSEKHGIIVPFEIKEGEKSTTYKVRLLLHPTGEPEKTFREFGTNYIRRPGSKEQRYFESRGAQKEQDPIAEEFFKLRSAAKDGDARAADLIKYMRYQVCWYVNVYVIDDPITPENNGTVKVIRIGKKLKDKITTYIKNPQYGARVFDLSANGTNFNIVVGTQDSYKNYDNSSFGFPEDLGLTSEQIDTIYGSLHDLSALINIKSYTETKKEFLEFFYGESPDDTDTGTKSEAKQETKREVKTEAKPVKAVTHEEYGDTPLDNELLPDSELASTGGVLDDPELLEILN